MFVIKKSPVHGNGLFATRYIGRFELVLDYTGDIISQHTLDLRYPDGKPVYVLRSPHFIIDAINSTCPARFCNTRGLDSHCHFVDNGAHKWPTMENHREIKKGEEIFVYYNYNE